MQGCHQEFFRAPLLKSLAFIFFGKCVYSGPFINSLGFGRWKGEEGKTAKQVGLVVVFGFFSWMLTNLLSSLLLKISHLCLNASYACSNIYTARQRSHLMKKKNSTGDSFHTSLGFLQSQSFWLWLILQLIKTANHLGTDRVWLHVCL